MATTISTAGGAAAGLREDLGIIASRWADATLAGMDRVALPMCARRDVARSGQVSYYGKPTYHTDDQSNQLGVRFAGAPLQQAHPGTRVAYNLTMREYGEYVAYDDLEDDVLVLRAAGGDAAVEQEYTQRSMWRCLDALDYDLLTRINAGTFYKRDGTTDSVVDCSGTPWSGSSTAIRKQLATALLNFDGALNTALLSRKALMYLKGASDVCDHYGGNVGAGGLTDQLVSSLFGSFGITKIYTFDTTMPLGTDGDAMLLCYQGGGDPSTTPNCLVLNRKPGNGDNPDGINVASWDLNPKQHAIYASLTGDFFVNPTLGVKLTGLY